MLALSVQELQVFLSYTALPWETARANLDSIMIQLQWIANLVTQGVPNAMDHLTCNA